MLKWKNLNRKIGPYYCISLKTKDGVEDCLSGVRGEIWHWGGNVYKAFICTGKNEKIITFHSKDLKKWARSLGVPINPDDQLPWANNPNSRFKD